LEFHTGIADTNDYWRWWEGCEVFAPEVEYEKTTMEEKPQEVWTGGSPIRIHLDMVTKERPLTEQEEYLRDISMSEEWCIAGTIWFVRQLPGSLQDELHRLGWMRTPLNLWVKTFKKTFDWTLRSSMFGKCKGNYVQLLRSIFSVATRDRGEADWDQDIYERTRWCVPKYMPCAEKPMDGWYAGLKKSLATTAREHMRNLGKERAIENLQEWWAARHHSTPGGSSSQRKLVKEELVEDTRLRGQDRPNKKAVVEVLDHNWMYRALGIVPNTIARTSTKNEPGDKLRALHANDDVPYMIEAFASVHLEKAMSFNGLYGKQLPEDVAVWLLQHDSVVKTGGYNSSLDFSNYNSEHSKLELALANMARAAAWEDGRFGIVGEEKAWANYWMANGHFLSFLRFIGGDSCRVVNGLFTGSRNTLTDHQYIHRAHDDNAHETLQSLSYPWKPVMESFVGDDADRTDKHWTTTATYAKTMFFSGHRISTPKQRAGGKDECPGNCCEDVEAGHTFLQRNQAGKNFPTRPPARIVATLASGNWYVEPGVWFDSAIQSTMDNYWEAYARGLDLRECRRMCCEVLDRLMVVLPEKDKELGAKGGVAKRLEWWDYVVGHPLFGLRGEKRECPNISTRPEPMEKWPRRASHAWMERVEHILKELRPGRREMYENYLLKESIGGSYHHYRQRSLRDEARLHWPERVERQYPIDDVAIEPPIGWDEMIKLIRSTRQARRPVDEEEQAARCGLDSYLVNLCGAEFDIWKTLSGKRWARYARLTTKQQIRQRVAVLDSSLRSWFAGMGHHHPALHVNPEIPIVRKVWLIWSGNCAGKSWLCGRYTRILDMDVSVYRHVGWKVRERRYDNGVRHYYPEAQAAVYDVVKYGKRAVMTQWPLDLLIRAAKDYQLEFNIGIYEPGEDVRAARMRDRGWDDEKVQLFLGYNRESVAQVQEWAKQEGKTAVEFLQWQEITRTIGY